MDLMNKFIISALFLTLSLPLVSCDKGGETTGELGDGTTGGNTSVDGTQSSNSGSVNEWGDEAISAGGSATSAYRPRSELATNPILKKYDENGKLVKDFLYIADPAAEVFNDSVYVYCSRDQPDATGGWGSMQDYAIVRSGDMVTWENCGVFLKPRVDAGFEYATGQMNAPDAARSPKDGMYYFYFPADKDKIGVAKAPNPWGPWETAVDSYIVTGLFDPTVFVDDDGQVYLYGNNIPGNIIEGDTKYAVGAKLNDDMVTIDGGWKRLTAEPVNEAVHVFKRDGKYYITARVNNSTGYWMSDTPLPDPEDVFYGGLITPYQLTSGAAADAPAHNSVIKFNNQWYLFYHRGGGNRYTDVANIKNSTWRVNDGQNNRRSACFDELHFNEDGTIIPLADYSEIVDYVRSEPLGNL